MPGGSQSSVSPPPASRFAVAATHPRSIQGSPLDDPGAGASDIQSAGQRVRGRAGDPFRFHSILFRGSDEPSHGDLRDAPEYFRDPNLDQIVEAVTAGWQEYDIKRFFQAALHDLDAIGYRQEVMRDLEQTVILRIDPVVFPADAGHAGTPRAIAKASPQA